jgi:nucleosome binding factor SPN SPT16 subunit
MKEVRDGVVAKDLYNKALSLPCANVLDKVSLQLGLLRTDKAQCLVVKVLGDHTLVRSKKPELEGHFVKNVGAGIGIELRDANMVLNTQ